MNLHGAMVQVGRLLNNIRPMLLPIRQVITEILKLDRYL